MCRTVDRLKWLITACKLGVSQESAALQLLRDCVGGIQDLVEINQQAGVKTETPTAEEKDSPKAPEGLEAKEVKEEAEYTEKKEEPRKKQKETKDIEKEKKKKKASKRKEKSASREASPGGTGPPVTSPRRKVKKIKEEEIEEHEDTASLANPNPGGESASSGAGRNRSVSRVLQETVDAYATAYPGDFELGTLPSRSRSNRHDEEGAEGTGRGASAPRSPDYPPPGYEEGGDTRAEIPRRWYPKPKKNKGGKHRERGRLFRRRDTWRQ